MQNGSDLSNLPDLGKVIGGWFQSLFQKKPESPKLVHLCDTCVLNFAECDGKPIFAIDRYPHLRGKDADAVVACVNHEIRR